MRLIFAISVALLLLTSCSKKKKYKPDESFYDTNTKLLQTDKLQKPSDSAFYNSLMLKEEVVATVKHINRPEPRRQFSPTKRLDPYSADYHHLNLLDSISPDCLSMCEISPLPPEPAESFTSINRYFMVDFENDIFTGKDYYFTNGAQLTLILPQYGNYFLAQLLPSAGKGSINHYGLSLRQNMYTSTNPEEDEMDWNDRPFSGVLLAEFFKISTLHSRNLRLTSRLQGGFIGEASLAASMQRLMHHLHPLGWQFQIRNDLLVNLEATIEKTVLAEKYVRLNFSGTGRFGTYLTTAGGGMQLMAGRIPQSISPFAVSQVGSAEYEGNRQKLLCWVFGHASETYTFYNSTLEGGFFNRSSPLIIEKERLNRTVFQLSTGIGLAYGLTALQLKFVYLTPEFSPGKDHSWGSINLLFNL